MSECLRAIFSKVWVFKFYLSINSIHIPKSGRGVTQHQGRKGKERKERKENKNPLYPLDPQLPSREIASSI